MLDTGMLTPMGKMLNTGMLGTNQQIGILNDDNRDVANKCPRRAQIYKRAAAGSEFRNIDASDPLERRSKLDGCAQVGCC